MCLGIPGKVVNIYESDGISMGKIDFGGIMKEVCLDFVPEIQLGDYAIIHVGFAITRLDEESAMETLDLLNQIGSFAEELGEPETEMADGNRAGAK